MSNSKPNYFQRRTKPQGPRFNERIRALDVQVIGSDGINLGVLPLKKAIEIARQAGSLYDKFQSFSEDLIKVGNNLNTTKNTYEDAMKKLTDGKDNLVRKTERLRELGAKTSKKINPKLVDRSK